MSKTGWKEEILHLKENGKQERGNNTGLQLQHILKTLTEDQIEELLEDQEVTQFFAKNGIEKPMDKADIETGRKEWGEEFLSELMKILA